MAISAFMRFIHSFMHITNRDDIILKFTAGFINFTTCNQVDFCYYAAQHV